MLFLDVLMDFLINYLIHYHPMIENPVVRLKHPLNKILRYRNEKSRSATLHRDFYWFDLDKS